MPDLPTSLANRVITSFCEVLFFKFCKNKTLAKISKLTVFTQTNGSKSFEIFHNYINRGSYMSAHVLLNLLNELGKRDKMRGLPSI